MRSRMATAQGPGVVEELVKRSPWEPRHEWESRVKFVEDHVDTFGLEKALTLSNVWANMKFLGCSYPAKAEALVAAYPVPDFDELRARRRKRRQSEQEGFIQAPDTDGPLDTKKPRVDPETHRDVATEVNTLISSIRMRYEKNAKEEQKLRNTQQQEALFSAPEMKEVARQVCPCNSCLGLTANAVEKLHRMFERFSAKHNPGFSYDYNWEEFNFKGSELKKCVLTINGKAVAEKHGLKKKTTKQMLAEDVIEAIDYYRKMNGCPPCPASRSQTTHPHSSQGGPRTMVTNPSPLQDPRTASGIRSPFFAPAVQKAAGRGGRYH